MFDSIDEIYEHIGQSMYDALPEKWDIAYFEVGMARESDCAYMMGTYFLNEEKGFYSINTINGEAIDSKCDDAFHALYKMMKRNDTDMPWNKARFELEPDGSFDLQFKFDEDLVWYAEVDPDSELYDSIDVDITDQIQTWEGLPEDMPRPWKVD